jgi:hypothetical protein
MLGIQNRKESPNICKKKLKNIRKKESENAETRNLRKPDFLLQSRESLYTCSWTPFIGRRRNFYIPRLPSNLENIPSANMYINDFYIPWFAGLISYIYRLATSSHFKPRLLRWRLWLGFSLTSEALFMKITAHWSSRIKAPLNSWTS